MASISGTVYVDLTDDGLDGGDGLIEGLTVELFRDTGNGTFESGTDTPLGTELTDVFGKYEFGTEYVLTEGTYFVRHDSPEHVQKPGENVVEITFTAGDVVGVTGTNIDTFDLTAAQSVQAVGPGPATDELSVTAPEAIGGERDLYVSLTSATGAMGLHSNPSYSPNILEFSTNSGSEGTRMVAWDGQDGLPSSSDIDFTGLGGVDLTDITLSTGIQLDIGAQVANGIAKVTIYTDASNWSESSIDIAVTPLGLPSDTGFLSFDDFNIGSGTGADFANVGAIVLEIEGTIPADGQLDRITAVGPTRKTAEFAVFEPVSLGNLVFNDINNSGLFDSGVEKGIAGVELTLWEDINSNNTFESGVDVETASTTTNANGFYLFDTLLPGDYIVEVLQTNFNSGGPLAGFITSTGNDPAPDPEDDVNNDDNGFLSGGRFFSAAVTLNFGNEPIGDGDQDSNTNLTVDFGFVPQIDLEITKSGSVSSVSPGEQFDYTLDITNNGPAVANNVTVVDDLPAEVAFISTTHSGYEPSSDPMVFNLGSLASGASDSITVTVEVDPDATGTFGNLSVVSADEQETDLDNNEDTADVTVIEIIDLAVSKTDSPDPVLAGENLSYTVTVINTGPSTATGVILTDTLPENVTFVSATPAETSFASGVLTFDGIPDLATDESWSVTIVVTVDSDALETLTNVASVTGDQQDSDLVNNSTQEDTAVIFDSDLSITKDVSLENATPGDELTYTLQVTNNGFSDATGVIVDDTLPTGVTVTSTSETDLNSSENELTFDLGAMAVGATRTITIDVSIDTSVLGTLTNSAEVSGDQPDSEESNNSAQAQTVVTPETDLAITKSASETDVSPGEDLVYTLEVTNNGPSDGSGVTVVDTLPEGVTFVSASPTETDYNSSTRELTFDLGGLAYQATETITIDVRVDPDAPESLMNTAIVSVNENDPDDTNNTAQVTTVVALELSSVSGYVYVDRDNDGVFDPDDQGIVDVTVALTGTDIFDAPVDLSTTTAADGSYRFEDLNPGTYTLTETQPTVFPDGQDTPGTPAPDNVVDDVFEEITLEDGIDAVAFNFGELVPTLSKRMYLASSE